MPDWNEENGNGQTVENKEGVKNYGWQRQKTIPLRKFKLRLIFILSLLHFKKSKLQCPDLDPDDSG